MLAERLQFGVPSNLFSDAAAAASRGRAAVGCLVPALYACQAGGRGFESRRSRKTAPIDAVHLPLRPPAGDPLEPLVRDVLAVAADVVDAARKGERRVEGAPCVGKMQGRAEA